MSNTKLLPAKTTRFSERKSKEELSKRKAEEELLALNPKKQMLRRNQEGKKEFEKKLLKDKANPFETQPRSTKTSAKPKEMPVKAKEIPKFNKTPKIDHKPIIPPPKKKKKIEEDDDNEAPIERVIPLKKISRDPFQQAFSAEDSFDSYSEEAFEEISFARKEKTPPKYISLSAVPKSIFSIQAVPAQKIITNEIPVLIKSSNQMTVELLHAVQLIFNDREEAAAVRVIEITHPEANPFNMNM
jgi:hypothetical protein